MLGVRIEIFDKIGLSYVAFEVSLLMFNEVGVQHPQPVWQMMKHAGKYNAVTLAGPQVPCFYVVCLH